MALWAGAAKIKYLLRPEMPRPAFLGYVSAWRRTRPFITSEDAPETQEADIWGGTPELRTMQFQGWGTINGGVGGNPEPLR